MDTNNIYFKIYQKKTTDELKEVIANTNSDSDTRLIAFQILEEREELSEELIQLKKDVTQKLEKVLKNEISVDRYNTFFPRLIAMFIDGVVINLFGYITNPFINSESVIIVNLVYFISIAGTYLYSILLHGYSGQTIGKMFTGVKIFDKSENAKLSFRQAIIRDIIPLGGTLILYILSIFGLVLKNGFISSTALFVMGLILIWSLLEIITMLFDSKGRALHDFIAGTVVLRIKEK